MATVGYGVSVSFSLTLCRSFKSFSSVSGDVTESSAAGEHESRGRRRFFVRVLRYSGSLEAFPFLVFVLRVVRCCWSSGGGCRSSF